MRRRMVVPLVAGAAMMLLGGCATTVTGTPAADTSVPTGLDVGSFATTKRTISPPSEGEAKVLEGRRMLETIPVVTDVDPAMKYSNGVQVVNGTGLSSSFGSGIGAAVQAMQVGVTVDYRDKSPNDTGSVAGEFLVALIRMPSAAQATKAVNDPAVTATDAPAFGEASPPKVPAQIPGYPDAKAFTETYSGQAPSTVAVLAHDRFVIGVWTKAGAGDVAAFFGQQLKGLDGFTPTPDDKLMSLPPDDDGVRALTLANQTPLSQAPTQYGWATARGFLSDQTQPTLARKDFDDAGVDVIGLGENNVYRARDAAGARLLADRFMSESTGYYPGGSVAAVSGVPGSRCYSAKTALVNVNYCVVPVGRYLSEYSSPQPEQAKQATAAAYLILRGAGS